MCNCLRPFFYFELGEVRSAVGPNRLELGFNSGGVPSKWSGVFHVKAAPIHNRPEPSLFSRIDESWWVPSTPSPAHGCAEALG